MSIWTSYQSIRTTFTKSLYTFQIPFKSPPSNDLIPNKHFFLLPHKTALGLRDSLILKTISQKISSTFITTLSNSINYFSRTEDEDKKNLAVSEILNRIRSKISPGGSNEDPEEFPREKLVDGLKNKVYKRIVFLTGAGISVSSGIPDFRSPKTGLYANLAAYNLPYPEAIFDIEYFKEKPQALYRLLKELLKSDPKPTVTHYFIKVLADEGMLFCNLTQNIDGLEVKAGLDPKYLVEAHGHSRTSHCIECRKEASSEEFMKHIQEEKVYRCNCGGLVKPDIIFFGEELPISFFSKIRDVRRGDLVFVMGTSLQVFPFASLVNKIPEEVPMVYINRENTSIIRNNFLFLEGDIDEQVRRLVKDLGWEDKIEKARVNSS